MDDSPQFAVIVKPFNAELDTLTFSVRKAAAMLGIGREAAYVAIREGRMKALRLGTAQGRWRVPKTELEAFIQRELERTEKK